MDPEVILIDTDSDSDCVYCDEGTDSGFFVISKPDNLDEPVENVSHSSSVSLPDLSISDCEISDSVAAVPAAMSVSTTTAVPAVTAIPVATSAEPEKLRIGCMSRSPILQKFMKASLLFKEDDVSNECGVSEANRELKTELNLSPLESRVDSCKREIFDDCISDENAVGFSREVPSADLGVDCLSRCVLSEQLVSVADSTNASDPDTAEKMQLKEEICDLEPSCKTREAPSAGCKGARNHQSDDDEDDDDLPSFLEVHQISKQVKQSSHGKGGKNPVETEEEEKSMEVVSEEEVKFDPTQTITSYSIDQLLAEHKETVRHRAMVADLKVEPSTALDESPNTDDLLPEHKKELDRMNVVENKIRDIHPGESVFFPSHSRSLFAYPHSLSLAGCGFRAGQSRTDHQLVTLDPDDLLEFLDPEFIDLVFPSISSKDAFLRFIFYLLSVSPDSRIGRHLHRIVYRVIHGRKTSWTPSTLDLCRVFVNYGASLCNLCPDFSLIGFAEKDLAFVKHETCRDSPNPDSKNSTPGFELTNLKLVLQLLTDALAVRPENYSYKDCLALSLILFRVSLDHRLSSGELHLDLEMFLAAVINAIPPDKWKDWVKNLCRHAVGITEDHHNAVYLIGLLPLVERGTHLQRVLSLVFMLKYLPEANRFEDLLEPKVRHSLNFLETLRFNDKESDFYLTWSLVNLLEYSVGSEALPPEANDFAVLIHCLQLKISKIKDYINKVDHILLKDLMVLLVSKWSIMARTFGKKELFSSASGPVMVQSISSLAENDSDDEANMDNA